MNEKKGTSGEVMHIHFSTEKVYEEVTFLAPHAVHKLIM